MYIFRFFEINVFFFIIWKFYFINIYFIDGNLICTVNLISNGVFRILVDVYIYNFVIILNIIMVILVRGGIVGGIILII